MNTSQTKNKNDEAGEDCPMDSEAIGLVCGMSRAGSCSSVAEDFSTASTGTKSKRKRKGSPRKEVSGGDSEQEEATNAHPDMENLRMERVELESFLFTENNKVSKTAIKFILKKWTVMERKVQDLIMANQDLKSKVTVAEISAAAAPATAPLTYSQVAASITHPYPSGSRVGPETIKKKIPEKASEIIMIKPIKEDDGRSGEQLRSGFASHLKAERSRLKIKNIRQMRQKGLLVEVNGKEDIEIIKRGKLDKIGLKVEAPKRINPTVIIYDVDKEHEVEHMKEDFVNKNFSFETEQEQKELMNSVQFLVKILSAVTLPENHSAVASWQQLSDVNIIRISRRRE